jgi:hypothetical protein
VIQRRELRAVGGIALRADPARPVRVVRNLARLRFALDGLRAPDVEPSARDARSRSACGTIHHPTFAAAKIRTTPDSDMSTRTGAGSRSPGTYRRSSFAVQRDFGALLRERPVVAHAHPSEFSPTTRPVSPEGREHRVVGLEGVHRFFLPGNPRRLLGALADRLGSVDHGAPFPLAIRIGRAYDTLIPERSTRIVTTRALLRSESGHQRASSASARRTRAGFTPRPSRPPAPGTPGSARAARRAAWSRARARRPRV